MTDLLIAIQDVQDMLDVVNIRGSACIYSDNGGKDALENILECLKEKDMKEKQKRICEQVEFGTYECYVTIPEYDICVDKCLAAEIKRLNYSGIKTIGCCCGHAKLQGYIQVAPEFVERMKSLGYEQLPVDENGCGQWCFKPKSKLPFEEEKTEMNFLNKRFL